MNILRKCPCGNEFEFPEHRLKYRPYKYCSRKCLYKYGNKHIGKISHKHKGKNHWNNKGDKAGYKALHLRVQAERGKASECEYCGRTDWVEWANMTGRYEEVNDYQQLCRSCHTNHDNQLKSQEVKVRRC